jgi:hypothetical protein
MLLGTGAVATLGGDPEAAIDAKSSRPSFAHYATPKGGELVRQFTLTDGKSYMFSSIYTLHIPGLAIGDLIQAHCQFQIANNVFRYPNAPHPVDNVGLCHEMVMHPDEKKLIDAPEYPPDFFEVIMPCSRAGENITPGAHYGFRTLVGSAQVAKETKLGKDGSLWISVIVYAVSDAVGFAGQKLDVAQHGGLSALVFRNPA